MSTARVDPGAETCASCGTVIPAGRARCPQCHRPRAPRWPDRGFALYLNESGTPMHDSPAVAPSSAPAPSLPAYSGLLPWLEFGAGCFGFNGIGLFFAGKRVRGILWFLFSLLRHAIAAPILIFTAGAGLVCIVPLNIAIAAYLGVTVGRILRREGHAALAPRR